VFEVKSTDLKRALDCAVRAAGRAGKLMRANLHRPKKINSAVQHDIKLELDVRCQKLIEKTLLVDFPGTAVLGEEGVHGNKSSDVRWIVDPIDGTVNFTYGIPHACISIALQRRIAPQASDAWGFQISNSKSQISSERARSDIRDDDAKYESVMGVVYDPFLDELWTATIRGRARLNGRIIRPSKRTRLNEAIVSLGFAKSRQTMEATIPTFNGLLHRVRKVRIMGAAALGITYVASGRFDAYVEAGIRIWDIAAAGLILECAGGEFWRQQLPGEHRYAVIANNGLLQRKLNFGRRH